MTQATGDTREALRAAFVTLSKDERALFEERAAIMEFDGGTVREDANREALWDTMRQRNLNSR